MRQCAWILQNKISALSGRWIHPHAANHAALHAYTLAYGLN